MKREQELIRFDRFVRKHGHSFLDKPPPHLKVKPDVDSLPEGFITMTVGEADYLFMMASLAKIGILEIGRRYGGSAVLMSWANREVPIHSIDIAPVDDNRARAFLTQHRLGKNTHFHIGNSQTGDWPEIPAFDLLFIDADHTYEGAMADMTQWLPRLHPRGHMLVHDALFKSEPHRALVDLVASAPQGAVTCVRGPYLPSADPHNWAGSLMHIQKWSL